MRKIGLWLGVAVVAGWALLYGLAEMRAREIAAREWPAGLGRVVDVPRRYPTLETNAAATKLIVLARDLKIDFRPRMREQPQPAFRKELSEYVQAQLKRRDTIDAPPTNLATYLAAEQANLAIVRAHLLAEPIVWQRHTEEGFEAPIPNLLAHMTLHRVFVANALDRARRGDAGAWDDLHASWQLSRSLTPRPELISQLIALAMARSINSAAHKMPLPEPIWIREMRDFDFRQAMLASWQAEAWSISIAIAGERGARSFLAHPYTQLCGADIGEHFRRNAIELARVTECGFDSEAFTRRRANAIASWNQIGKIVMPNVASAWQRMFRFRAELEATERINQIRGGVAPSLDSRCSEGKWLFEDGRLRFSAKIPNATSNDSDMPLEYP